MIDDEQDSYIQACRTVEALTEHALAQREKAKAAEDVLCAVQLWYEKGDDAKLEQAWREYQACSQKEEDASFWVQLLRDSANRPTAIRISEKEFKNDPAMAIRAAKNVPHVTVTNGAGQVRMVIVRQRTDLEDTEES